jgi:hypothetical protein
MSWEEPPQPIIAHSKTVKPVIINRRVCRTKLSGMTAEILHCATAIARMRNLAPRFNPIKFFFGVTPWRQIGYFPAYWHREGKVVVLRPTSTLQVPSSGAAFICKAPRNLSRKSLSTLRLSTPNTVPLMFV